MGNAPISPEMVALRHLTQQVRRNFDGIPPIRLHITFPPEFGLQYVGEVTGLDDLKLRLVIPNAAGEPQAGSLTYLNVLDIVTLDFGSTRISYNSSTSKVELMAPGLGRFEVFVDEPRNVRGRLTDTIGAFAGEYARDRPGGFLKSYGLLRGANVDVQPFDNNDKYVLVARGTREVVGLGLKTAQTMGEFLRFEPPLLQVFPDLRNIQDGLRIVPRPVDDAGEQLERALAQLIRPTDKQFRCVICGEEAKVGEQALHCRMQPNKKSHRLHKNCGLAWVAQRRQEGGNPWCPTCRAYYSPPVPGQDYGARKVRRRRTTRKPPVLKLTL